MNVRFISKAVNVVLYQKMIHCFFCFHIFDHIKFWAVEKMRIITENQETVPVYYIRTSRSGLENDFASICWSMIDE